MKTLLYARKIRKMCLFLPGLFLLLQGCSSHPVVPIETQIFLSPTRQLTKTSTPLLKETQTPTYPFPTFDPSFVFNSSDKNEFEKPDSILFSSGPGTITLMDIYSILNDGSDLECITCNTRQELEGMRLISPRFYSPAWSPNGTMYAYVFSSFQNDIILIRGLNIANDVRLIEGNNSWYDYISWSPDGTYLAFSEYNHEKENNIVCYIKVNIQQSDTENKICLSPEKISDLSAWDPSWSQNGKSIIFSVGDSLYIPSGKSTDLYQ